MKIENGEFEENINLEKLNNDDFISQIMNRIIVICSKLNKRDLPEDIIKVKKETDDLEMNLSTWQNSLNEMIFINEDLKSKLEEIDLSIEEIKIKIKDSLSLDKENENEN